MKGGIEYFPLNVALDDKFGLIEAEFGLTGFSAVIKLLQKIYGEQGYYCEWNGEVALLFARKIGLGGDALSRIVDASIRRGIFDRERFERYGVLTSRGIQKRYFEAVSRRKTVEVVEEYLVEDCASHLKNADIRQKYARISSENDGGAKQRKGNESKENESKEKQTRGSAGRPPAARAAFVPPTVPQVEAYCAGRGSGVDARRFVDFYTSKGWMVGKNKMADWKAAVRTWERGGGQAEAARQAGAKSFSELAAEMDGEL
jgi:hypothetical protein